MTLVPHMKMWICIGHHAILIIYEKPTAGADGAPRRTPRCLLIAVVHEDAQDARVSGWPAQTRFIRRAGS
jgi:hypothetical protein